MIEIIKNNQCLKIRVAYDQTYGRIGFEDFVDDNDLECLSDFSYAYFPNEPRWTESEINGMTEEERLMWKERFDWDWTRYTLADVSWKEWFEVAEEEELLPYRYTVSGHCQADWSHLYLLGMDAKRAEDLSEDFELYAYETPYRYMVKLIDCETGDEIAWDSLGGIYDDADLTYLKEALETSIKNLDGIDEEVKALALEAVNNLDYTAVED